MGRESAGFWRQAVRRSETIGSGARYAASPQADSIARDRRPAGRAGDGLLLGIAPSHQVHRGLSDAAGPHGKTGLQSLES